MQSVIVERLLALQRLLQPALFLDLAHIVTAFSALQPIAAAGVTLAALASRPRFRCRGAADARCLRPPAASDGLAAALVVAGLSLVVRTELRATRRPRADYVGVELEER